MQSSIPEGDTHAAHFLESEWACFGQFLERTDAMVFDFDELLDRFGGVHEQVGAVAEWAK